MNWSTILPTVASFLGGPAGGIAAAGVEWLASKFGASDKTVAAITATLNQIPADQLAQMTQIDNEFKEFCLNNQIQLQLAQIGVNNEEAKSVNLFIAGWRPFLGWIGGFALAYVSIIEPIMRFVAKMNGYTGDFPVINTEITFQVLSGMLGIGIMRTVEKVKNAEGNR